LLNLKNLVQLFGIGRGIVAPIVPLATRLMCLYTFLSVTLTSLYAL